MSERHQLTNKELQQARDEFRGMLEQRTSEAQWQRFFTENPYVLSMSLPVLLAPQDIVPMGRPGLSEPDFVFFAKGCGPFPTYGVIELKRPDSKIITVTRSNAAILSRDAETAIQQATDYSRNHREWRVQTKQDSILILGNRADLFVIMGMSAELSRKLGLELYREMIEKRLPRNLKIIPYDALLGSFEAKVPSQLHLLVPADASALRPGIEETAFVDSELREMLTRAVQHLPTRYRVAFVLHDVEGMANNEVAAALDVSVRTSRLWLQRARLIVNHSLESSSPEVAARWIKLRKRVKKPGSLF